jgi:thioredoxin-dependent peroxiredoxin
MGIAGTAYGQRAELKVGDPAPPFTLPGSDGKLHSLSDHLGIRPVVLAWFPRVLATI